MAEAFGLYTTQQSGPRSESGQGGFPPNRETARARTTAIRVKHRKEPMDTTRRHIEVCALLLRAETAAQEAANGDQAAARTALRCITEARQRVEQGSDAGMCEHPECSNTLTYVGRGRPPRFCSPDCRESVYRATQIAARALLKSPAMATLTD
ncbi:hypothetical protein [Streptomyces sp. NPDC045369]|uniref:hypothetical protein n=1 Tax=Streptomyces sp. NPDC045369 TaxID=3155732 RepID=UPI00340B6B18